MIFFIYWHLLETIRTGSLLIRDSLCFYDCRIFFYTNLFILKALIKHNVNVIRKKNLILKKYFETQVS